MKKSLLLTGVMSLSVFLSACSGHSDQGSMGMQDKMHADNGMDHKDHMKMMTEYYFNQMDANQDGVVSMKEFMTFQRMKFREADTNHDGNLTMDEVMAQQKKEKHKMWEWKREHADNIPNGDLHNGDARPADMHYGDDMHSPQQDMHDDGMNTSNQ